jgi:glutaredoxin-related protein
VIEGTTDAPGSPSSLELVTLLKNHGVKYVALDVNQRKDQLLALQAAGVITSVPSLFIDQALIGDLDQIKQLD